LYLRRVRSSWNRRYNNSWIWYFSLQSSSSFLVILIAFQGATVAQARAALRRYNDVMEAAERIFGGAFDDIHDESSETSAPSAGPSGKRERWPVTTRLVVHVLPRALPSESLHTFRHQRRKTLLLKKLLEVARMRTKVSRAAVSVHVFHYLTSFRR
jgi:hypothetical protein